MLELYQLQQLVAVADNGTLSAAADALNLSQPALTRSMQKLEGELGLPLFDRQRNKVELNEAGHLAVEQARHVLSAAEGMESRMRDYARAQTTISVGSCAPGPMWELTPELTGLHPDKTIAAEMKEPEALLSGLLASRYQLIVMDVPVERAGILCKRYLTERLYISLPPAHPLAAKEGIYLSDLAGQTMLLYSDLGVWHKLREKKMGGIHFIIQTEREAFADLINASVLPNFTSDLTRRMSPPPMDRVDIPILDPDATITFYLCATQKQKRLWDSIPAR